MKHSASGFFPLVLCCEKFDTLHGKAVNALHQRFSRNIIFTATTLDLKHILSMADIFHVPLTYLQPDQSLFIERAAEAYGKKGKIEAQHLAFELTELFASGELTPQDMDGIMYEMHKAYFKYREQKREKERIMNL